MKLKTNPIRHIYLHIPFCKKKCGYCSFYSIESQSEDLDSFFRALQEEIRYYKREYSIKADTIYLGGGTPSLLPVEYIAELISLIPRNKGCEITIEVNPQDINEDKVQGWLAAGINRISIGLQSMKSAELEFLGRRHSLEDNYRVVSILQKNKFNHVSFDLIYGLPGQSIADVEYSLKEYMKLYPDHISTYCLSLAEDCVLAGYRNYLPADETLSDMYYSIRSILVEAGWQHYELSNFCQNAKISKHNLAYWQNENYLGCGPSAAGYVSGFRYQNPASLMLWQQQIWNNQYFTDQEEINDQTKEKEFIILALRTIQGLRLEDYKKEFENDFKEKYEEILAKFSKLKLLEEIDGYIRLNIEGYFISNEILSEFV